MSKIALLSAPCEATGHPTICIPTVEGSVEPRETTGLKINDNTVATHADVMFFSTHGHERKKVEQPDGGTSIVCGDYQSHELVPRNTGGISVNDKRVMQEGDTQDDPGVDGTASIIGTGQPHQVTINGSSN